MAHPAVDHVDLVDAGFQRMDAAGDLGQHTAGKNTGTDQFINFIGADGGDHAGFIRRITHDTRNVAQKHQLAGTQLTTK